MKMCAATGHIEPDIVGNELEASQSLVCLYECEEVGEQPLKKKYNCMLLICQKMQRKDFKGKCITHFNLLFGIIQRRALPRPNCFHWLELAHCEVHFLSFHQ